VFFVSFWPRFNELRHIPDAALIPNADRELGAIATSLMQSGAFADTHGPSTGPMAHLPPVYPLILSLIYRRFGLTPAAG
jgi:hypothetical protein